MGDDFCKLCTCVDLTCVSFSAHYTRLELCQDPQSSVKDL